MIIVVTGGIAAGKTHWIRQQIAQSKQPSLYFSPQTETFPIDRLREQLKTKGIILVDLPDGQSQWYPREKSHNHD